MKTLTAAALCFVVAAAWSATSSASLRAAPLAAAAQAAEAPSEIYQDVYNGWKWWHVYCYRCHGTDALGTTTAPALIDPNEKMSRAQFVKTVREGVKDKGMAAWDKLLDAKQMGQLYVYVRARADKVLPPGRPDEVGPNKGPWEPGDWTPK
jgi:mono/diheme cytochrome c family protein